MHIIIGMPPHIIIIGAPMAIIDCMASQRSFMRGIIDASVGIIFIIMPSLVISQVILHIIGIMPMPIIGIIIGMPIWFIIIGFMPIIDIMGIMFIIGFMPIIGFMLFIIGIGIGIGIAFIMVRASYAGLRSAQALGRHARPFPPPLRTCLQPPPLRMSVC